VDLQEFLDHVNRRELIKGGSELHLFMHGVAQEALHTIARLNTGYHTADEVRALLTELTGRGMWTSPSPSSRRSTANSAGT